MRSISRSFPVLSLLGITVIWGWTFVVVRDAVSIYPAVPFLALRFGLAAVCLLPVVFARRGGLTAGLGPGVPLAMGYLCQTVGLQHTTASRAGLFTGLFVILTPAFARIWNGTRMATVTPLAGVAALTGTILLASGGETGVLPSEHMIGDALEICTAILFSIHLLLLERVAHRVPTARLALGQMLTVAVLFAAATIPTGHVDVPSPSVWWAIGITGILASALAFWVQSYAQKYVSATRAAVILAAEPAFAVFFGVVLAHDRFSAPQAVGAVVLLAAILLHEVVPALWERMASREAWIEAGRPAGDIRMESGPPSRIRR